MVSPLFLWLNLFFPSVAALPKYFVMITFRECSSIDDGNFFYRKLRGDLRAFFRYYHHFF